MDRIRCAKQPPFPHFSSPFTEVFLLLPPPPGMFLRICLLTPFWAPIFISFASRNTRLSGENVRISVRPHTKIRQVTLRVCSCTRTSPLSLVASPFDLDSDEPSPPLTGWFSHLLPGACLWACSLGQMFQQTTSTAQRAFTLRLCILRVTTRVFLLLKYHNEFLYY